MISLRVAGCGEACFEKGMFLSLAKSRNLKNLNLTLLHDYCGIYYRGICSPFHRYDPFRLFIMKFTLTFYKLSQYVLTDC